MPACETIEEVRKSVWLVVIVADAADEKGLNGTIASVAGTWVYPGCLINDEVCPCRIVYRSTPVVAAATNSQFGTTVISVSRCGEKSGNSVI
jgi:hypothetical protein